MDRDDFFQYRACPRGAGDRDAHRQKDLWHVFLVGRYTCMAGEAVWKLRGHVAYAGVAP